MDDINLLSDYCNFLYLCINIAINKVIRLKHQFWYFTLQLWTKCIYLDLFTVTESCFRRDLNW